MHRAHSPITQANYATLIKSNSCFASMDMSGCIDINECCNKEKTFPSTAPTETSAPQHYAFHDLYLPQITARTCIPINFICNHSHIDIDDYCHSYTGISGRHRQHMPKGSPKSSLKKKIGKSMQGNKIRNSLSNLKKAMGKKEGLERRASCSKIIRPLPQSTKSLSSIHDPVVKFHSEVTVCSIPSADDYPCDVWSDLWLTEEDIIRSIKRNKKEFDYDFWDWKNATEEEDMVFCPQTGELMHPVHIDC
mmetsp:Transcript_45473/g.68615  ORF Transcript_45473/g.68615 Transcript_45473/m.68615 type:complete len:249 (+) Transcript_45473:171-917(+)